MKSNIYQSATVKLTAWYVLLVMAISLIFSGVVYHFATDELAQGLTSQQQRIYRAFPIFSGNPLFVRTNDLEVGSRHILQNLFYFNTAVLVGAGFASYWLAKRTLKPIEASNERQKRFVADASHELRTPLTALKMSAEVALLDENMPKQDLREALKSNLEEANKLDTLLNTLLRLSQLETNNIRHKFTLLSTGKLVKAAIEQVQKRAAAKHIAITNKGVDLTVVGEQDSLVQLLVILLDNAIKYSPENSTITITTASKSDAATITVSDQGIGIEPSALNHVFDRFYRADKARTRGKGSEGFGLGLSIAKHIADIHQAHITLTSTVNRGTRASISLPTKSTIET